MSNAHGKEARMSAKTSKPTGRERRGTPRAKTRVVLQVLIYVMIIAGMTFLIAGRWDWWMAWLYFAAYLMMMLVGVAMAPLDQELIEERTSIKDGVKRWDKMLTAPLSFVYPLGLFVLVGVEMRFGPVIQYPLWAQLLGLAASIIGQLLSTWAMTSNKFYGRFVRIQKERGHYVIMGGPYRFIRHPGYLGVMMTVVGTAFAIGSLWTLVLAILITIILVVRTALEDKVLRDELEGYLAYAENTRFRLVPGIW
jgi:protein-S-isoprenylcysteine O-methyltransferase Ste14